MTTDTVREQEAKQATTPQTTPIEEVVDRVREHSRQDAQAYLEDSTVPHGGE